LPTTTARWLNHFCGSLKATQSLSNLVRYFCRTALASCPAPEDGWHQPEPQVVYAAIAYSSSLRGSHPCQAGVSPLDVALIDAAIAKYLPVDRVGVGKKVKGLRSKLYWQPGAPHPKNDPSPRNPNELSVVMHRPDMASVATFSSSRPLKTVLILWKNQQTRDALIKEIRALLKLGREGEKTEYKTSTGATAYSVVYSGDEGSLRIKSQHVEDLINPLDLSDPKLKLPENANRDERRQKAMDTRIALFHEKLPVRTEPSAALIEIEEKETYESKYVDPYLATRIGSMQKGYVNQRINPVRNEQELQAASTNKKTGKVNQKVLEEETKRDESRVRSAVGGLLMQCGVLPIPLIDNKDKGISSATWLTCCYVLRRTKKTTVDRIPNTAVIMVRVNSVSGLIEFTTPKLKLQERGWVDSWEIYRILLDEKWDVNSYYEAYPEQVPPEEWDNELLKEQHLINHFIAEALKETLSTPIRDVAKPHLIFMAEAQNARKLVKWLTNDPNFKSNVLPPAIKRHFEQESVMQRLSVIRMRVAERREVPMWVWQDKPGKKRSGLFKWVGACDDPNQVLYLSLRKALNTEQHPIKITQSRLDNRSGPAVNPPLLEMTIIHSLLKHDYLAGFVHSLRDRWAYFSGEVTVHGGVHHAHKRQSLAKQKLWVLCASKYRT